MKKKKQELTHGNQVVFARSGSYDHGLTHTIIDTASTTGDSDKKRKRIFRLRGSDKKIRFGGEHELRRATRAERY